MRFLFSSLSSILIFLLALFCLLVQMILNFKCYFKFCMINQKISHSKAIYPHQYDEMRRSFLFLSLIVRILHVTLCEACVGWNICFLHCIAVCRLQKYFFLFCCTAKKLWRCKECIFSLTTIELSGCRRQWED